MPQPKWRRIAQLGDVNPCDYGGYWIFEDARGVYCQEAEWLDINEEIELGIAYRFSLEIHTYINGILSDNKFHPEHPVWYADKIGAVGDCCDVPELQLIKLLCSHNSIERAEGYRALIEYFGPHEFDHYPSMPLPISQLKRIYSVPPYAGADMKEGD